MGSLCLGDPVGPGATMTTDTGSRSDGRISLDSRSRGNLVQVGLRLLHALGVDDSVIRLVIDVMSDRSGIRISWLTGNGFISRLVFLACRRDCRDCQMMKWLCLSIYQNLQAE